MTLDGTVDSSPIYVHGLLVVTTTYGRTEAIAAATGAVRWRFTPPGYSSWAGSAQITTATPVADPTEKWIYAASPGGRIYKLSASTGRAAWSVSITKLPSREKIASALNYANGHVIADYRRLHRRPAAVPGSRRGHRRGERPAPAGVEFAVLEPRRADRAEHVRRKRLRHLGPLRRGRRSVDGRSPRGHRKRSVERDDELGRRGAPAGAGREPPARQLHADGHGPAEQLRPRPWLHVAGRPRRRASSPRAARTGTSACSRSPPCAARPPHKGGEVQIVSTPSGTDLFTAPAVWRTGSSTWLFAADNGGTAAWRYRNGHLTGVWQHPTGGTSPVVAGGLLWVYNPGGGLNVYKPASGALVATLPAGGGHWNSPIVVDGHVALPEGNANDHATSGVLDIWSVG